MGYQENFLTREFKKMGYNITVITSDRYLPFANFQSVYEPLLGKRKCGTGYRIEEGVPIYRLPVLFEVKCRVWLRGLKFLVLKLKPDLIISRDIMPYSFEMARLKKKDHKFKLIVDSHETIFSRDKNILRKIYFNFLRKIMVKKILVSRVDKFTGATQEACNILEKKDDIPKEKIKYIPLGTDTDLFKFSEKERKKTRVKLNISKDDILLLYTGKIIKDKKVDILVKAFNRLDSRNEIHLLLLSGIDSKFKNNLLNLVKKEKRKNIIFNPLVPYNKLPSYYSASDICIWPGSVSISMLDAMACGRSIIGYDCSIVKERIANKNGLTYQKGDYEDLTDKISYLVENNELRKVMGERGRRLIEDKFSWNKIANQFIDCITKKYYGNFKK